MKKIILSIIALVAITMSVSAQKFVVVYDKSGNVLGRYSSSVVSKVDFITDPYTGHDYVDLGLSVKWATCNVGATSPEKYGDYFAWGETETKSSYYWTTYTLCNGSSETMTKYCTESKFGKDSFTDSKTTLEPEDDAAHVNWGGKWRMPTHEEQNELYTDCTWTWTDNYNKTSVKGYIVTSKKEGYTDKSIFLPAAGMYGDTKIYNASTYGYYWSSSLNEEYPYNAWDVYFTSSTIYVSDLGNRYLGYSIRAVAE